MESITINVQNANLNKLYNDARQVMNPLTGISNVPNQTSTPVGFENNAINNTVKIMDLSIEGTNSQTSTTTKLAGMPSGATGEVRTAIPGTDFGGTPSPVNVEDIQLTKKEQTNPASTEATNRIESYSSGGGSAGGSGGGSSSSRSGNSENASFAKVGEDDRNSNAAGLAKVDEDATNSNASLAKDNSNNTDPTEFLSDSNASFAKTTSNENFNSLGINTNLAASAIDKINKFFS